jgi:hypothetical protein
LSDCFYYCPYGEWYADESFFVSVIFTSEKMKANFVSKTGRKKRRDSNYL